MAYFKIGNTDFSNRVNELNIKTEANYNAQTNSAGNTVVDYINKKREIEVGIIPLNSDDMKAIQNAINAFNVKISFRNPKTGVLEENVDVIIPENEVSYYTIQTDKVLFNEFSLTFIEL